MSSMDYVIYYRTTTGTYVCHSSITKQIQELPYSEFSTNKRRYNMLAAGNYTPNIEGLTKAAAEFPALAVPLANNKVFKYDVFKSYTLGFFTDNLFLFILGDQAILNVIRRHTIGARESAWIEANRNSGLMVLAVEPGIHPSFGYDMKSFYPSILAAEDFMIPICAGTEIFLSELPDDLPRGFFSCFISCDNPEIRKFAAFNKNGIYTDDDIKVFLKYQQQYDVKIVLSQNNPNAYIYDEGSLISGKELFGKWFTIITKLRLLPELKSNILLKHATSSLHGSMTAWNKHYVKAGDFDFAKYPKDKFKMLEYFEKNSNPYFALQDIEKPYKHQLRIKAFIHSYARRHMGNIAALNPSKVIRMMIDNIVYSEPQVFPDHIAKNFLPEAKTTGLIHWKNAMRSNHVEEIA